MIGITHDTDRQRSGLDINALELTPLNAKVLKNSIQEIVKSKASDK
jgi:hypothetical protein